MIGEADFGAAVEEIYATATDWNRWRDVLTRLNVLFGGTNCALFLQDTRSHAATMAAYVWDDPYMASYAGYYAARNPWLTSPLRAVHQGSLHTSEMMLADAHLIQTEFYADWMRPQDLHHMIGGCVFEANGVIGNITVLRPRSCGSFGDDDVRTLALLQPHIVRALDLHQRLAAQSATIAAREAALDLLPTAVAAIDSTKRIVSMNAAMEALLRGSGVLAARGGMLTTTGSRDREELTRLLDAAVGEIALEATPPATIELGRNSGNALAVTVRRVGRHDTAAFGATTVAALVFVTPVRVPASANQRLRELYGLTPTEVRVVSELTHADSLAGAAAMLGVTENTVRTHLKSIFAKTSTRRQSQLTALVARLSAALP